MAAVSNRHAHLNRTTTWLRHPCPAPQLDRKCHHASNNKRGPGILPNPVYLVSAGSGQEEGGGQNARATGGPGILPGASNEKASAKSTASGILPAAGFIAAQSAASDIQDVKALDNASAVPR